MGAHDLFFGRLFQHRDNAVDLLRWTLPPAVVDRLDWATLEFERSSSRQRRERHSDLVFSVATLDGAPIGLHIILEHQRKPERDMPVRVVEYLAHGWLRQREGKRPLTRILPIVLFHGSGPWPYPTSVQDMMPDDGLEDIVGDLQLRLRFLLVDLGQVPDEQLEEATLGAHAKLGLLLLKNAPSLPEDVFWAHLRDWATHLAAIVELPDGSSRLRALFDYIVHVVGEPSKSNLDTIMAELPEPAAESIMTWAEALEQRGIEKGIEEGIEKGIEKGIDQGIDQGRPYAGRACP